jgi:hypothetical protein
MAASASECYGSLSPGPQHGSRALERADHAFAQCGVSVVSFTGIYKPEQLSVLCKVLNDHCARSGIDPDPSSPEYEDASYLIMALSRTGASTIEELKAALDAAVAEDGRRQF